MPLTCRTDAIEMCARAAMPMGMAGMRMRIRIPSVRRSWDMMRG